MIIFGVLIVLKCLGFCGYLIFLEIALGHFLNVFGLNVLQDIIWMFLVFFWDIMLCSKKIQDFLQCFWIFSGHLCNV